jgi:hypothetical protein
MRFIFNLLSWERPTRRALNTMPCALNIMTLHTGEIMHKA